MVGPINGMVNRAPV
uniref:Uncharacterized protein n=1 Tax=Rhizophora mucronata TaxID=61149 RepID=A0A2P2LEN2_RHIMU